MSGGGTDKFCLRWNDFETNISSAFRDIRDDKDLFDVTLSCGPRQVQAHKLILSACSPFFRTVFKQNPHQHPLLYLKGIQYDDLQSVLNFMYHGEVNVAQEDLNNFLAVAEELKIKGLTQNNSEDSGKSSSNSHPKQEAVKHRAPSLSKPPPLKMPSRPAPTAAVAAVEDDDIQEVVAEVKAEPGSSRMEVLEQYQDTSQQGDMVTYDEGYDYADYGEGEAEGYGGHMVEAGADQDKGGSRKQIVNTVFYCNQSDDRQ